MRLFRVVILYREPTFERRIGPRAEPFRGSVEVHAEDAQDAIERARAWFRKMESQSWVGWLREIERIEVHESDGDGGDGPGGTTDGDADRPAEAC